MAVIQGKMEASKQGAKRVGKKRSAQPKEVARTMSGKFGARLAYLTEKAGLTPEEFADKIGRSRPAVYTYFAGRSVPHLEDWPIIAKVLGVSVKDLLPE
jgi:ribosome-binding protein aMBF1 (putative translation factor)